MGVCPSQYGWRTPCWPLPRMPAISTSGAGSSNVLSHSSAHRRLSARSCIPTGLGLIERSLPVGDVLSLDHDLRESLHEHWQILGLKIVRSAVEDRIDSGGS